MIARPFVVYLIDSVVMGTSVLLSGREVALPWGSATVFRISFVGLSVLGSLGTETARRDWIDGLR